MSGEQVFAKPEKKFEREPQIVEQIHFLVHPGYLMDPKNQEEFDPPSETFRPLLEKYVAKAQSMGAKDIMVVVSHILKSAFVEALKVKQEHAVIIERLKNLLNDRLVVIFDDEIICDLSPKEEPREDKALSLLVTKLQERGYKLDQNHTRSIAYGESVSNCVDYIANELSTSAGFSQPTIIDIDATDYGLHQHATEDVLVREIKGNEDLLKHIKYQGGPFEKP